MNAKANTDRRLVRIHPLIQERVYRLAAKEQRTLTNMVSVLLAEALKRRK